MRPNEEGRPQGHHTPGTGPASQVASTATEPALILRGGTVAERRQRRNGHRNAPTARVSLLLPAGRRTNFWYLARCPVCGAPHLGRAKELAGVTGARRLPCRHWVTVVIARTYGQMGSGAAA